MVWESPSPPQNLHLHLYCSLKVLSGFEMNMKISLSSFVRKENPPMRVQKPGAERKALIWDTVKCKFI